MKKGAIQSALLIISLLCINQLAWASGYGYFAKATAKVSSKSNGHGAVYMGPAVTFAGADKIKDAQGNDATVGALPFTYDENGCPNGVKDGYTLETEMPKWLTATGSAIVERDIELTSVGTAQPVWAVYQAVPAQGYYLKGWSTQDNDAALGNQNPFAYSVQSQAMAMTAAVNEVMVYMNSQWMPMGYYVAEGNSNRYLYAQKNTVSISGESQTVYQCYPSGEGYTLFEMQAGVHLYIPHRDNVNQRMYVIDDDGKRVDKIDGGYLPVPSVADASYIIFKNPATGTFHMHRYNPATLGGCATSYTYGSTDFWNCVQQAMLTYYNGEGNEPLLVSFQRAKYTKDGQEIAASAVVSDGEGGYNAIQFLPDVASIPQIPTIYATFAPVQVNGCTGGNIVSWTSADESAGKKTFDVTFSTSYASSAADFGAVTFDKQPTAGGTYSATISNFDAESGVVTISVTFTGSGLADGEYKSSMTLQSKGGESKMATLVNVRKGAEANKAVAIGDNKYDDLASALSAAKAGDELVLLSDVAESAALGKNITLNLDGWTLSGNVTISSKVTLKNGAVAGAVSVASTGNLTVDGTTINGTLTNAGTALLRRGTFNGGSAVSILNSGTLTLEKGAEIMADNNAGVVMAAGSNGTVNGAKFHGPYPIQLAEGSNGVFNAAYFTQAFAQVAAMGLTHYDVTVGAAYEAGYTHLYAANAAAAKAAGAPVCRIGQTGYTSLEDALLFAQNNPTQVVTIIMTNDYVLPAGYYTLPANANLLIPYQEGQASIMGGNPKKLSLTESYVTPTAFRTLTFANGVHMTVVGSIEASCRQFIGGQAATGNAVPSGGYGWLKLEEGADMTLGNGSHLYAWGFVTGEGEIDARRGSAVHEDFQVYDWPGGSAATNMLINSVASGHGAFPINQYFMQNVESQLTFHPGARMYASFGASAAGLQVAADAIQIVGIEGDVAMFLMNPNADADNTWVRKRYEKETDTQVWEVNSGAHLGSMVIEVPAFSIAAQIMPALGNLTGFDSRNFILPITNNMKIHLLTGYMDITQNTELLPGAEIEVDKEATVEILSSTDASSGFLYLIDNEDWSDAYACNKPAQQVLYSPSFGGAPNVRAISSKADLPDAKLNVHGTFQVSGMLMTTTHGANIFSTNEDAGTMYYPYALDFMYDMGSGMQRHQYPVAAIPNLVFDAQGEGSGFPIPAWNANSGDTENMIARTALLRNGIGEAAQSGGSTTNMTSFSLLMTDPENWNGPYDGDNFTMPGESFCYVRDRWTKMTQFDERFAYNNYEEWYIKPSEYVAIATTAVDAESEFASAGLTTQPLENADHTYSDAAGEGRLFIWVVPSNGGPGQWWEVTLEDNLYKGKNGTYYTYSEEFEMWVEMTYAITFLNWEGSPVLDNDDQPTVYYLHYGDRIQYLGTNPTRDENVDYTYTFTGWSPAITADTKVTGNATYTATFEATQRKYTIIFLNENGTEIERQFLTRDEMPACENTPSKTGYFLQWSPAIGAVTGDQEYRATFTPEKPTKYTITFKNYNGSILQTGDVNVGETPACPTPSKPATNEYTYEFAGWNPAIEPVSQEMTYTAKFNEVGKTYAVRFFQENGTTQIGTTQNLAYGAAPAIPDYNPEATAQFTYTTTWTPQVAAVTGAQDYVAVVTPTTNKYTVTINATGCVVEGAGAYDYGTEVTLKLGAALSGYENPQWSDGTTANKTITVTENVTYAAAASIVVTPEVKTINLSGSQTETLTEDTKVASLTIEAGEGCSAQLFGAEYIDMMKGGKAYFKYNFGSAAAYEWHAFAVPFKCDAQTAKAANGSTLRNTHEYDIVEYDGAVRAAQGKVDACWKYVSGTLVPGKLYMIIFNRPQTVVTFTGKDNLTYYYNNAASVTAYGASESENAGWNGIANPALFNALLSAGVTYGQEYVGGGYSPIALTGALSIAKPIFVQTSASQSVVVTTPASPVVARHAATMDNERYVLHVDNDKVFLISDDMSEDAYVVGEDLMKFGVSTKVAQVWVNRYNSKLCVNHAAAEWGETTFPLGIYAPKAGQYTLSLENNGTMAAYLMENGVPVWNFQNGDCVLSLAGGTGNSYAICVKEAPKVVTEVQDVAASVKAEKVLIDGVLYILCEGKTFDATGRLIK